MIEKEENKNQKNEKENIQENFTKLKKIEEDRDLFQNEIDKLKADVKIKLDKIEKLGNLT